MTVLRDLSIILLAIEAFVLAMVPLTLLGGLVYGLWWLRRHENLPSWLHLAQTYLDLGKSYVELAMAAVVRPIFLASSVVQAIQRWLDAIATFARGGNR
jgi:hypothetical protein